MKADLHITILRIGLGVTFVWIGYFILQDPVGWAGFIKPWARDLLIFPPEKVMQINAIYDIAVGLLLIGAYKKWMVFWGGILAALHMAAVLTTAGVDPITVRDIAILAGALTLVVWARVPSMEQRKVE